MVAGCWLLVVGRRYDMTLMAPTTATVPRTAYRPDDPIGVDGRTDEDAAKLTCKLQNERALT